MTSVFDIFWSFEFFLYLYLDLPPEAKVFLDVTKDLRPPSFSLNLAGTAHSCSGSCERANLCPWLALPTPLSIWIYFLNISVDKLIAVTLI